MFLVAMVLMTLHRIIDQQTPLFEVCYRWISLLPLGLTLIFTFIMLAFFPDHTAKILGWPISPFQYQLACANLGFGVISILSCAASYEFRLATVIGVASWLWVAAAGHIYQIQVYHAHVPSNAGSWLFCDFFVPALLVLCILKLKPRRT